MHISIVSPVFKAEKILPELVERIESSVNKITNDYEIILVEDGSPDNSWEVIEQLSKNHDKLKGYKFSRNFGQHIAITAGLDVAVGKWIVVMDCDLQDKPEEILKLYNKAQEGYDYVQGRRLKRKDNIFKKVFSSMFYRFLEYLTESKIDPTIANFGIYNSIIISSVNKLREQSRWFPTFINWVGFKGTSITIDHGARQDGKSSYTFRKLFNLALDVIILNSNKPLKLIVKIGFIISLTSMVFALLTLFRYVKGEITVSGWTSIIISIWFLSGIIIFTLGIIGLYLSKVYDQSKNRPLYIVKQKTNFYE